MDRPQNGTSSRVFVRFSELITARRAKWIILAFWILLVGALTPVSSKLSDVINNDSVTFLPENAESAQVAVLQDTFQSEDEIMAVIVYARETGLTDADLATIDGDRTALSTLFPNAPVSEPIPSQDGRAALVNIELANPDNTADDQVDLIRETVTRDIDGLSVHVTGPAGFLTDLVSVFAGIDTRLLLATAAVVTMLLLLTYRSPVLWIVPLATVAFANQLANAAAYGLAEGFGVTINGQTQGILPILVFGAGTDYALLLIARYREELRRHESTHEAMAVALRSGSPAILASGSTVVLGLLCLLVAELSTNKSLGPVGAAGILAALTAMLTLLPALLLIGGRKVFWPFVPEYGSESASHTSIWGRVGAWISERPRPVWIATTLLLIVMAFGLAGLDTSLSLAQRFRGTPESIAGQQLIAESFPAGSGQPTVVIANADAQTDVEHALGEVPGVVSVTPAGISQDGTRSRLFVTTDAEPSTTAALDVIKAMRTSVHTVAGAGALVGGPDAEDLDTLNAVARDARLVIPLVYGVVLIILMVLLRAIAAPIILILTNVLSNGAALGVTWLVAHRVFGFGGLEPGVILLGFVFLVALGIDYNIFLMSRVHEEAQTLGTRQGMLQGLATTGGVITSAGLVLAATFAVLSVLPLVSLTELGFLVAFGVLLDTLVVRPILVPALTFDIGGRIWWPTRL